MTDAPDAPVLLHGAPVQVLLTFVFPHDPEWSDGYTFDSYSGRDEVLVRPTRGLYAGQVVRYLAAHVRPAHAHRNPCDAGTCPSCTA